MVRVYARVPPSLSLPSYLLIFFLPLPPPKNFPGLLSGKKEEEMKQQQGSLMFEGQLREIGLHFGSHPSLSPSLPLLSLPLSRQCDFHSRGEPPSGRRRHQHRIGDLGGRLVLGVAQALAGQGVGPSEYPRGRRRRRRRGGRKSRRGLRVLRPPAPVFFLRQRLAAAGPTPPTTDAIIVRMDGPGPLFNSHQLHFSST